MPEDKKFKVAVAITNEGHRNLTTYFMKNAINMEPLLREKFNDIWTKAGKDGFTQSNSSKTNCRLFVWPGLTEEQFGIICGTMMAIDTSQYQLINFDTLESYGNLTEKKHGFKLAG